MARVQCNSCGGVYDQMLPDGMQYFHVCPPLSLEELDAAVRAGRVVLPRGETVADAIARRAYVRAGARNENVVRRTGHNGLAQIYAEGQGVTILPPAPAPGPVVVPD